MSSMLSLPSFNLIGPGRLGQTLARLWHDAHLVTITSILGRDKHKTDNACHFIGSGQSVEWEELTPARITLLATPDDMLAPTAAQLTQTNVLRPGDIVFHCSGACSSEILSSLHEQGACVASIHPLTSFAQPRLAIADFSGTYCGYEGDGASLEILLPLFSGLGANCFPIDPSKKTLYHAGAVLACNALVALMHAATRSMAVAGIPQEIAWPALRPLIDGSLANIDKLGTRDALTGPIARGDAQIVEHQYAALSANDELLGEIYAALSKQAILLTQLPEVQQHILLTALR